ncbi:MAG: hypothetical protein OXH00_22970 [Candidatus Poribacteria bacterium]|nr:hypothetical protein [Candidatus Poribacteria bacterium]
MNPRVETTINEPGESGCLDVVFSDAYSIARGRRREVAGTTSVSVSNVHSQS